MFRASVCGHCREVAAADLCPGCGLWICPQCQRHASCAQDHLAWTGACRSCGDAYADEQRRDVLDDGDGQVMCRQCGWRYRLRRFDLLSDRAVAAALKQGAARCSRCDETVQRLDAHLVLHAPADKQMLYHLLCACGNTLASAAGPRELA